MKRHVFYATSIEVTETGISDDIVYLEQFIRWGF